MIAADLYVDMWMYIVSLLMPLS